MLMRLALRAGSLAAKLALTVVITRTLGFSSLADYGLAVALSVVASKLFGLGFSAELNRRLAATSPSASIRDARSLSLVYVGFYLAVCAAAVVAWREGGLALLGASSTVTLFAMIVVAIAEHHAFEVNSYVFSLHRANAGTWMLFARTGLWPMLAIAGLLMGVIHGVGTVLLIWVAANIAVIVWAWRLIAKERQRHASNEVDERSERGTLWGMWKEGCAFYLAAAVLSCMQYAERFIAAPFLTHNELGRYVFAWSVANAVQTLSFATFAVTSGPALARAVSLEPTRFVALKRRAIARTLCATALLSLVVMSAQSAIFGFAHEKSDAATLGILLTSFVMRAIGDILWGAAVALRAGRALASGMVFFAAIGVPLAWFLIPRFGVTGAALAHLFASAAITVWLVWVTWRPAAMLRRECLPSGGESIGKADQHVA
jgi:O-antigen/teichoic acid export membrane protein